MTTANNELENRLRDALRFSTGDPAVDAALHDSLLAGIPDNDPQLLNVYVEEVGPEQAELDMHLDGPSVQDHATNAKSFAEFIVGISEAVKETAKQRAGKGRYTPGLLVEGVTPGSVRVVLKAPPPVVDPNQHVDSVTVASTVDSDALRAIAAILAHASDPDPESPLVAEIHDLPKGARKGLRRAIRSSRKEGWTIGGTVRQRRVGISNIALSPDGAGRLQLELDSRVESTKTEKLVGQIDGFRRSLGTMYFFPEGRPQLTAGAMESELATKVAELFARGDVTVEAIFNVVESRMPGDAGMSRQSRSLLSIRLLDLGEQRQLGEDFD